MENKTITLRNGQKSFDLIFAYCPPGMYRITNQPLLAMRNAKVTITEGFWLQELTVTLGLYEFVTGNPYIDGNVYYGNNIQRLNVNFYQWFGIDFTEIQEFI